MEVILNEGDMLFIPSGWIHFVFSEKRDVGKWNLAINFWLASRLSERQTFNKCSSFFANAISVLEPHAIHEHDFDVFSLSSRPFVTKASEDYKHHIESVINNAFLQDLCTHRTFTRQMRENSLFQSDAINSMTMQEQVKMSLEDMHNVMDTSQYNYFMGQVPVKLDPRLAPPHFVNKGLINSVNLWWNTGNVQTMPHYDTDDNVIFQMHGSKRILLFPPSEYSKLYMFNPYPIRDLLTLMDVIELRSQSTDPCIQIYNGSLPLQLCDHLVELSGSNASDDPFLDSLLFKSLTESLAMYRDTINSHPMYNQCSFDAVEDDMYKVCSIESYDCWKSSFLVREGNGCQESLLCVGVFIWILDPCEGLLEIGTSCITIPAKGSLIIFPSSHVHNYRFKIDSNKKITVCCGHLWRKI